MVKIGEVPRSVDPVIYQRLGRIGIVTINRPDANNAISDEVRDGITWAMDTVKGESDVRCVIITGAGEDAFSVGSDIAQIGAMLPEEARRMAIKALTMHERVAELDRPVIAAIKGACIGAGLELALHCDIRFARVDSRFGLPGVNVGLVPGGGSLDLLARTIGGGQARALGLTGGVISAERAFMMGLVTNVVVAGEYAEALDQLSEHLASLPPVTVKEIKRLMNLSRAGRVEEAKAQGVEALARCFEEGETRARLRQLFGGPDPEATLH